MLDDFIDYDSSEFELGEIVFHLGNISEDILPDGKKQYENGLPVKACLLYTSPSPRDPM